MAASDIRAVVFDAYGTLFDVYSVSHLAEQLFPGRGDALAALWRDKQIEYSRLRSMSGRYKPFWDLTADALRYSCARLGLEASAGEQKRLMDQYACLSAFPENLETLRALKAQGLPLAILSNGSPEMLEIAVKSAGMSGLFDHVLSAHAVQRFKTDAAVYQLAVDALHQPARQILFVSSNGWDAVGATWFGFTTCWINRSGQPPECLDTEPTATGRGLNDVLALVG